MSESRILGVIRLQLFALLYLQKFMLAGVSLTLLAFLASTVVLVVGQGATMVAGRVVLFAAFALAAAVSQLDAASVSTPSVLVLAFLTFVLTLRVEVSPAGRNAVAAAFSDLMLLPAALAVLQVAYQLAHGVGESLSLDALVPRELLMTGYVSESSTEAWKVWNRSNGLIFLEPSFCSAYLACALCLEVERRRRAPRLALFGAALLAANGGTGWTILLVALPVMALRRNAAAAFLAGAAGVLAVTLLQGLSAGLPVLGRLDELADPASSGYGRLVLPLATILDLIADPAGWMFGHGAGSITTAQGSAWPVAKLAYEYGALPAALYLGLVAAMMAGDDRVPLRCGLFVAFQFTGGYLLSPFMVILVFVLCVTRGPPRPMPMLAGGEVRLA